MLNLIDIKNLAQLKLRHLGNITSEECLASIDYGRFTHMGKRRKGLYLKSLLQILHQIEMEHPEQLTELLKQALKNKGLLNEKTNS